MRFVAAMIAAFLLTQASFAQQFTDATGTTFQLQQQCDGFGHCTQSWVPISTTVSMQAAPAAQSAPPVAGTVTTTTVMSAPVAVGFESAPVAFPLLRAVGANHPLIQRLFHPFARVRQRLGVVGRRFGLGAGGCGCGGAGCACR